MITLFETILGETIPTEFRWIAIIIGMAFASALIVAILDKLFPWRR